MRALCLYLGIMSVTLITIGQVADGMTATSLADQIQERNAAIEALR